MVVLMPDAARQRGGTALAGWKPALQGAFALALTVHLATAPIHAAGGELVFDVQPVTLEGRTLVPVRPIFEWLGAKVEYDAGHLRAFRSERSEVPAVELWLGSTDARVAGAPYRLDVAPQLLSERLFVPLRFVAESFGVWVEAQGRQMKLSLPQEGIEAVMAIPPHPQSLLGKMWVVAGKYYGLIEAAGSATPHWDLFSKDKQHAIIADVGADAPTIVETHWGGREVIGIRVLDSQVDSGARSGWMQVRVLYGGGEAATERLDFVLEPAGWRISNVQTDTQAASP